MAMTGGMALGGDHFGENKETSPYWLKQEDGSSDFFDEYVILDDDDSLGPEAHTSRHYYEALGLAPDERLMSPLTSIDTSLLVQPDSSIDGTDHTLLPAASTSFHHSRRYNSQPPETQRHTQQTLLEQSRSSAGTSSAQRQLTDSISDSEIQRLEGLSVQSPRRGTAPAISSTVHPPPRQAQSQSPKKRGRMEMIYASIRKATTMRVRAGPPQAISTAPMGSSSGDEEMRGRSSKQSSQMPMTPPPTGRMGAATPSQNDPLGIAFVNGQYDDPFGGPFGGGHGQVDGFPGQHGYSNGMMAAAGLGGQPLQGWPLQDGYASSSGNSADDMAWTATATQPQYNAPSTPAAPWYPATPGNPQKSVTRQSSSEFGAANAMNATLNLALHLQQGGQIYHNNNNNHHHHYGTASQGGGGGGGHQHHHSEGGIAAMHMPQSRHNGAALLQQQMPLNGGGGLDNAQSFLAAPTHHHSRPPRANSSSLHAHGGAPPSTPRRPKPRAPSSGARHASLSLTSPRKQSLPNLQETDQYQQQQQQRGRSISTSPTKGGGGGGHRPARRVTSAQDLSGPLLLVPATSPSKADFPPAGGVLNASVRKRRSRSKSMSRRASRTELRTPSHGSSVGGMGESPTKAAGGGQIGFVNYTPDDSKVLMTGVAPSGSSKTKARREREATERQRRLSEAVMKAVAAAGGDVERLREEGIMLDGDAGVMEKMVY